MLQTPMQTLDQPVYLERKAATSKTRSEAEKILRHQLTYRGVPYCKPCEPCKVTLAYY